MPLPLIPVVIGLVAMSGTGVGFGIKGGSDMARAKQIANDAKAELEECAVWYQDQELSISEVVQAYGYRQCELQAGVLGAWLEWLEVNEKKVRKLRRSYVDGVRVVVPDVPSLRLRIMDARSVVEGTASAAIAAVAAQQAALFGVRSLAMASTGVAISTLSGVAAENAMLAWLGGGALSAGGGGMAAGTMVLGGLTVAPALLIGGLMLSMQGEKALTQAMAYQADVEVACEQMVARVELFDGLRWRIEEMSGIAETLGVLAMESLESLASLEFDPALHAEEFQETALLMRALGEVLSTPLLDADGQLSDESVEIIERYAE